MEKTNLSRNSSLLVSKPALLLWAGLCAVSAAAGHLALSGLFLFFLLLFSFLRYWAERAMVGVSLEVRCSRRQIYPGMETQLEYELKNDKLLPLAWLELSQQKPEKDCVVPDDSFEPYSYQKDLGDTLRTVDAYKRGFSMVMAYESISLSSTWQARCRGIYCPRELLLRSGDGFGLSQVEKLYPASLLPEIVVYPRAVAVDADIFLRQDWDKSSGALGFKEDMSVLRGLRPYSNSDSWKRINWRMAARQPDGLQVNFYETVQPSSVLFVFDGESYCKDAEALEQTLETLASLITLLISKGVSCGLCLPRSKSFGAVSLASDRQLSAGELLYYLAGFDCLAEPVPDKEGRPTDKYRPSAFEYAALRHTATEAGTVVLITNDASGLPPRLLERPEQGRLMLFSSGNMNCRDKELKVYPLSSLRKGGGA